MIISEPFFEKIGELSIQTVPIGEISVITPVDIVLMFVFGISILSFIFLLSTVSKSVNQARAILICFISAVVAVRVVSMPYVFYMIYDTFSEQRTVVEVPYDVNYRNIVAYNILKPLPVTNLFEARLKIEKVNREIKGTDMSDCQIFKIYLSRIWDNMLNITVFSLFSIFLAIFFFKREDIK